jgi:hypothetical protein
LGPILRREEVILIVPHESVIEQLWLHIQLLWTWGCDSLRGMLSIKDRARISPSTVIGSRHKLSITLLRRPLIGVLGQLRYMQLISPFSSCILLVTHQLHYKSKTSSSHVHLPLSHG